MKYFILAGEASGDKQAALLCKALRNQDPDAILQGWGGEDMMAEGVQITKHYRQLAFMGFVEVLRHLPEILRNFKSCKKEILAFQPDALILVDYPGFNLRIAAWAHKHHIPVYYYISPQLWAWHTSRVHNIRKAVRKMYVILPFEKEFYKKHEMEVVYIGHPLAAGIPSPDAQRKSFKPRHIALLPGSRRHEVERLLPVMVGLAQRMTSYAFTVVAVPHLDTTLYAKWIGATKNIQVVVGNMKQVLAESEAAVVTSGTATLETALHGVPQVVVYKGSPVSYQIAKRLVKVPYISLVNLIMGKSIVPELIQAECTSENIHLALTRILEEEANREIRKGYSQLHSLLMSGGGAPVAAKDIISDLLRPKPN